MWRYLVLVSCFLFLVSAQPVFPQAFSASVELQGPTERHEWFRWFYDYSKQNDRYDSVVMWENDFFWTRNIVDYTNKLDWSVLINGDEAICRVEGVPNATMINPDWSGLKYVGTSLVQFQDCDHYAGTDENGNTVEVWVEMYSGGLVRWDFIDENGDEISMTFHELDVSPQELSLFYVTGAIASVCYSSIPTSSGDSEGLPEAPIIN